MYTSRLSVGGRYLFAVVLYKALVAWGLKPNMSEYEWKCGKSLILVCGFSFACMFGVVLCF